MSMRLYRGLSVALPLLSTTTRKAGVPKAGVRTLIMAPRRRGAQRKKPSPRRSESMGDMRRQLEINSLDKKMEEVRQLSRNLKLDLAKRKEERIRQEIGNLDEAIDPDSEDVDLLYQELTGPDSGNATPLLNTASEDMVAVSLFNQPARGTNVPASVLERLGDAVKFIHVKDNQDWNAVIDALYRSENAIRGVHHADIFKLLSQIPVGAVNEESLVKTHEMLMESKVPYIETTYDFMMKQYAELGKPVVVQQLFDNAMSAGMKPTKYMFGHLIKVYSRTKNMERVNLTLTRMFNHGIEPSKKVYTNVLQMCVQLKDVFEANEVFQMMKFRSLQSQPDIEAYNTMIQLAAKTGDVHKALDLYQELLDSNLKPTVFTFNCLAQTCSKDKNFYRRGWEFLFKIHEHRIEPNVNTFEIMLRLAAKDGDLELARSLYVKIFEMRPKVPTAGAEALNYLMIAYRDFKPDHVPQITLYKEGLVIRRNIMSMVDFLGLHQTEVDDLQIQKMREVYPPMLPVKGLHSPDHIMAESNAVWTYSVSNDPNTLTLGALQTFLRVAVEHGDQKEFMRRFEQFTFANGDIGKNQITIEEASESEKIPDGEKNDTNRPPAIRSLEKMNYKIERESSLYVTLLSAGRRFKDEKMCQMAWIERGKYRKTSAYQSYDVQQRKKLDFQFSREMVLALLELKSYTEAVGVVMASTQFPWSFYYLKPLYVALQEIGDNQNAHIISDICNSNNKLKKRLLGSRMT